ncbi:type II toxin-antitoxin system RelE/ParE family toxin [Aquibium oceanicum]|uniref:Type II toxin-antitoxin system RelE/ParE family toxin n=1 Tax=Aquibium oceanicum TaxID=1670800 RepID=A0A1L3SU42_9HYPH|nr:type II toxin-antitoxin system RelE/ParE family toxin [Aquibium oceanicum]APH72822.1 hypothetical protein BSQ44_16700 [Aquibium oceanicum]
MRRRRLVIAPEAEADLVEIEEQLLRVASSRTTNAFLGRIFAFLGGLQTASERGHRRDDIRRRLRIIGFERRLTIAFAVHEDRVDILRVFRAGRDWEAEFDEG